MDLNPDLPTGDEKAEKVQGMFDRIAPRYDFVNRIMTFRLDVRWRKQTVQALELEKDSLVIDQLVEPETFVANLKMLEWFHSGLTSLWGCCKQGGPHHPFANQTF